MQGGCETSWGTQPILGLPLSPSPLPGPETPPRDVTRDVLVTRHRPGQLDS